MAYYMRIDRSKTRAQIEAGGLDQGSLYIASDDIYFYTLANADGTVKNDYPLIFKQDTIVINPAIANTFINALTKSITFPTTADYMLTLTFNYNSNTTTGDVVVRATLGGNAIDSNNRDADGEGQFQILRTEMKDSANSSGGAITGTGSGQKLNYNGQFLLESQPSGTRDLVIDIGSETASLNSIWNIVGKIEKVNII